ncbi:peroxisomal succinyl-coenzyme A thioesterase-like isoform X3 [Polypterus senegalus]|nr:peroxisomal succinyl-coenzyme A thioesterase-like isoform X3 [Polypterus senegalus]XP_039625752.1 peroxisomal succinyl-coenzyme A thioesterase-like isoform X3 [Polypterus senegalus]XP_039625753.1 peroxisomal succinyl-coenzyme A thioesterase-like isoform X3 [Polypterus senegalus]XP_039625754.1 peroxisomal succinyl-coenzyme A thioesterase-like isoform X3 [Polypterus senegalus]
MAGRMAYNAAYWLQTVKTGTLLAQNMALHKRTMADMVSQRRRTPRVWARPTRALMDEPFQLEVACLPPHCPVTLRSTLYSEGNDLWEAFSHYVSDERGRVNVSKDESLGGLYIGREPMGLLWSLRLAVGGRQNIRLRKKNIQTPLVVDISLFDGHNTDNFNTQTALAMTTMERWYMAPGVRRIEVRENGVVGTLFIPPGPGPFPALLDVWGLAGFIEHRAALLASRGYACLALAYINHPELQLGSGMGISYFQESWKLLQSVPQVSADRLGLLGSCFGAAIFILMASELPDISPRCLVAINSPSGLLNPGEGNYLEKMQRLLPEPKLDANGHLMIKDAILAIGIDLERSLQASGIQCPVLLVVGEDDQCVPALESAQRLEAQMRAVGKGHLVTKLSYPEAGHLIEPPYHPVMRSSTFIFPNQTATMLWGGVGKPHAAAQEDSWRKILEFLDKHL